MNKIVYNRIHCLTLSCLATVFMLLLACKKNVTHPPVITGVRNYAPAPGDSLLKSLVPGQWVVLLGHNLRNALQISYDGVPASFNSTLFSDTSAVVQVPSVIPFPSVPAEEQNIIRYTTTEGTASFTFNITAPPPTITAVSNENANTGDSVYIYGANLFFIKAITFAGTPVTGYASASDGMSIGFVLPALTQSGPLVITTQSGTTSTAYNVNDVTTGVLCNFDNINTFSWGTYTDNSSTKFPGNHGYYAVLNNPVLPAGESSWWNGGRSINTNGVQWVPVDSLKVPVSDYALKFEISVPDAWNGGSIYVLKDYNMNYLARYEPWKDANGVAFPFTTKGWRTVTLPLSMFRTDNGKGTSAASLTDLLGTSGNGSVNFYTINDAASPTATGCNAAIDNIRVVKIK